MTFTFFSDDGWILGIGPQVGGSAQPPDQRFGCDLCADLTMLSRLAQALSRARTASLAA